MKLFGFFVLALTLSLMACKGDMGDIGPAGAQGEQGIQGEQGVQGEAGEDGRDGNDGQNGQDGNDGQNGQNGQDGEDGNANVMHSDWFDVIWDNPNSTFGIYRHPAPEITEDIKDRALILGYVKSSSTSDFLYPLPVPWNATTLITSEVRTGTFGVWYSSESTFAAPTNMVSRYVIIPPAGRLAENSADPKQAILDELEAANVDINNYDEVAKYLEIR